MKFPYVDRGYGKMPIIPVTLSRGDDFCIVTDALVDSGAGQCIFDAAFAQALGIIDVKENATVVPFEGVSGHQLIGYQHEVMLEVGGHRLYPVPVAFSEDMPDNATNILGQVGFFDWFPIVDGRLKRDHLWAPVVPFEIGGS